MSNDSSSSGSDEEFLEHCLSKLKPYDFEPLASSSNEESESDESNKGSRKGKVDWCQCGYCQVMEKDRECWCCSEANEISDELFEGTILYIYIYTVIIYNKQTVYINTHFFLIDHFTGKKCVTETTEFHLVCLELPVLKTTLATISKFTKEKYKHDNE